MSRHDIKPIKLDLQLEKTRKEKEDLAKELEKAENEVVVEEMRRRISFWKSTYAQENFGTQGQGMSSGNIVNIANTNTQATNSSGTSSKTTK